VMTLRLFQRQLEEMAGIEGGMVLEL